MKNRPFIAAAVIPMLMLVMLLSIIPILYNIYLSTTDMSLFHYHDYRFVGAANYINLFTSPVSDFSRLFVWNVIYSLLCILVPFVAGVAAAQMLAKSPRAMSAAARPLIVLPWVVPAFITILVWKGLFNYHFGAVNGLLGAVGIEKVPWLIDPIPARISVLIVSVWLAIPFMTVSASGIMRSLPAGIFEAAWLDGAGPIRSFFSLTLPLVTRRMIPILVLGFTASFNNFTAIYLLTSGGPAYPGAVGGAGATDIIISYIFKLTLMSRRYGLAAAYAVVVFAAVGIMTIAVMRGLRKRREETF
ncbi:MAG: sugar ABC transporter permease [Deltaproteobacteria bacterium]|nr:sugar ABC transporter permease [Candidatus Zymogenaceae bacterium]